MKRVVLFLSLFLLAQFCFGQSVLKVVQPIQYYKSATFSVSPTAPIAVSLSGLVNLQQMMDSISAMAINAGTGSVLSVSSGLGLTGGPITTTGTLALDTANVTVLSRQRAANTYQVKGPYLVAANIEGKLNVADSSGVGVGSYVTGKDFAVGLATKQPTGSYLTSETYTGTVSSIAFGLGLSGGTVTGTGTVALDTANASVLSRQRAVNTYVPKSHIGATGTAHGNSTTSVAGFMSSTDKTKLDGIATGATANTGTVTSVAGGLGLSGGTITATGTLALDTANATVLSRQRAANTYQPKGSYAPGTTVSNATHSGDATGSTALTLATVNSNVGTFNNITINAKGLATAGSNVAYVTGTPWTAMGYLTSQTSHTDVVVDGDFSTQGIMLRGATPGSYSILTNNSVNWNGAYTDRLKWDGGATGLTAETGRTSLGLGSASLKDSTDFIAKGDTVNISTYISGTTGQLAKFTSANVVGGITTGSEGQVLKVVSGVPAFANESAGSAPLYADISANLTTTSTTLTDATGLVLSLAANSKYVVDFMIAGTTDATLQNVGFAINLSSTTGASILGSLSGTTTIADIYAATLTGMVYQFNTASVDFFKSATYNGAVTFTGRITTGSTAPTIQVKYQTSAGTFTIYAGSYIKATKI